MPTETLNRRRTSENYELGLRDGLALCNLEVVSSVYCDLVYLESSLLQRFPHRWIRYIGTKQQDPPTVSGQILGQSAR